MARARATDIDALVWAAAGVFEQKGYRNTTIDDIAEAAGVSRPTVYKYTKSKRSLLARMVDVVTGDLARKAADVARDETMPAKERLEIVVQQHIVSATQHRNFYAILFSERAELPALAARQFELWAKQVAQDFQGLLDECVSERPDLEGLDTWIASNLILSMLTSLYRWYDPKQRTSPTELTEQIMMVLGAVL